MRTAKGTERTKRLTLRRETLRRLTADELRLAIGGRQGRSLCSDEQSGCV